MATANKRYEFTKNFPNGDRYHGEAVEGNVRDGRGEFFCAATGTSYSGEWVKDLYHGVGKLEVPASNRRSSLAALQYLDEQSGFTFTGSFEKGKRSGQGVCVYGNGMNYIGEWREDKPHGKGVLQKKNDSNSAEPIVSAKPLVVLYEGEFAKGLMEGLGRCQYHNGDVYEGAFKDGLRHGRGVWEVKRELLTLSKLTSSSSSSSRVEPNEPPLPEVVRYCGDFVLDEPCSPDAGQIQYADGAVFDGGVEAGLSREGRGVMRYTDGTVYTGAFWQNQRHGPGTLQCQDGRRYEGHWTKGVLEDSAVRFEHQSLSRATREADGQPLRVVSYEGPCVGGVWSGPGARGTFANGARFFGTMKEGELTGAGTLNEMPVTMNRSGIAGGPYSAMLDHYEGGLLRGLPTGRGKGVLKTRGTAEAESEDTEAAFKGVRYHSLDHPSATASSSGLLWDTAASEISLSSCERWRGAWVAGWVLSFPQFGAYEGEWRDGVPEGAGVYHWPSGTYAGAVKEGVPHGSGRFHTGTAGGSRGICSYEGSWVAGNPHGTTGEWCYQQSGEAGMLEVKYTGGWESGWMEGIGCLSVTCLQGGESRAGSSLVYRYEGEWRRGKPHGKGKYETPFEHFEGNFCEGQREGEGKVFYEVDASPKRIKQYCGRFHEDWLGGAEEPQEGESEPKKKHPLASAAAAAAAAGHSELTLVDGTRIVGAMYRGQLHGPALIHLPGGTKISGFFSHHQLVENKATITFPNGDVYMGEVWLFGARTDPAASAPPRGCAAVSFSFAPERHGRGVNKFIEGGELACVWEKNVLHGEGTYRSATGETATRVYEDGHLIRSGPAATVAGEGEGGSTLEDTSGRVAAGANRRVSDPSSPAPSRDSTALPASSVFTAENEFPNSLSEEQHKATARTKPFPFQKRGTTVGTTTVKPTKGLLSSKVPSPAPTNSKPSKATPAPTSAAKKTETEAANRSFSAKKSTNRETNSFSARISREETVSARRASAGDAKVTTAQHTPRVQQPSRPSPRPSPAAVRRASIKDSPTVVGTEPPPSGSSAMLRSPLHGPLSTLMDAAQSIRNSHEDEIHYLTEKLRSLNENIWQLRFCVENDAGEKKRSGAPTSSRKKQLKDMHEERKAILQRLQAHLETAEI